MSKYIFLKKKIILGKTKKIYTKKESKKEYVKYKNRMINVAKYKKIKNYNSKKMKGGGPRTPSLIGRRTRNPSKMIREIKGPSLIRRTTGHSLIGRTRGTPQIRPTKIIISAKPRVENPYALDYRDTYAKEQNFGDIGDIGDIGYIMSSRLNISERRPPTIRFGADKVKIIPSREELLYRNRLKHFIIKKSRTSQGPPSRRSERPPSRRPPSRRSKRPPSILRHPPSVPPPL